ncbi:hypothetical protein QQP08_015579 [Theobroma cacao]|nr:hypothetical protein QQP08_015579 [Theobroma cacao]
MRITLFLSLSVLQYICYSYELISCAFRFGLSLLGIAFLQSLSSQGNVAIETVQGAALDFIFTHSLIAQKLMFQNTAECEGSLIRVVLQPPKQKKKKKSKAQKACSVFQRWWPCVLFAVPFTSPCSRGYLEALDYSLS